MKGIYFQIFCPYNEKYSIIIEDDERVCYAYLLVDRDIVGDVWLYNREIAPGTMEWKNENMPFLNPLQFIDLEMALNPITSSDQVELTWRMEKSQLRNVQIHVRGELIAKMTIGSKPGWSAVVKADGPLAKKIQKND
jgi:hypothetical protein